MNNEIDREYVNALNSHTYALEMNTMAMNQLRSVLERIFSSNGLDSSDLRTLGSLVSEIGDIAAHTNSNFSAATTVIEESTKRFSGAADEMKQAADKNVSASYEMTEASKRNLAASGEMLDAARRY